MLGASCLVKDTQLKNDLSDLVQYVGFDRIVNGKDASLGSIYNVIRKAGIEVDLQTVGFIYNEVLPKEYSQFQSDQEVNDYTLKSFNDAIRRAALLEQKETKEQQIGEDAPEIYVTNGILNMFYNSEMPDEKTQSDMLKMQNALWKGVQRKLKLPESKKPNNKSEWKDILNQALGYEELGLRDLNGRLNSISDLYNAMREQLGEALSEAQQQADPSNFERLNEMVNGLEASTYSLLFSKKEAKQLLDDIMKESGFGKELKNGKTILDWNKLAGDIGSIQDLRENVQRVLEDNGYNQDVIDGVKLSLENEFNDLQARMLEKLAKELSKREGALNRETTNKSDLRRLAELNNLGIFDSQHDRLLYNLLGVGELQQQDMEDLKQIAQAASNLYRKIDNDYGSKSEIFASREFQSLNRLINGIIQRNINKKNILLKIISWVNNYYAVYLSGLLSGPLTIMENKLSGVKEWFAPVITGRGLKKEDFEVYRSMMADVTARGQAYGEEIGSFAPRELYTNIIEWNWGKGILGKGTSPKEKAESLLYGATIPARVGLLAFDSANKVIITNSTFKNAIYSALTQGENKMTKEDAIKFMSEALYGESFDNAKKRAKELLEMINADLPDKYKKPINNNTINVLANDIVKANLNANGALTNEVIEAAYKSSYHVAGYGLGHEPNNLLSKGIKGLRTIMNEKDKRLAAEKKWNQLAFHRFITAFTNNIVIRFTGGATNWVFLRLESLGVGLVTGYLGKWVHGSKIDFDDKKAIQESIKNMMNDRNKIGRALVGLSYAAIFYMVGYALYGGEDDKEKKKKLEALNKRKDELKKTNYRDFDGGATEKAEKVAEQEAQIKELETSMSVMKRIKKDWMKSRIFKKTAPDVMLIQYYMGTEKNELMAATRYVQNTYGLGSDFSTASKIQDASALGYKGELDAGYGQLASIAGDKFGVPLWRAGKDWFKLGKWIAGGKVSSDYKAPASAADGMWGGGMLEDLGVYKRNPAITILPGIGAKGYELFKAKGITNMTDLKKTPDWWNATYTNDAGNEVYILNATDRIKAKEAAKEWFGETK